MTSSIPRPQPAHRADFDDATVERLVSKMESTNYNVPQSLHGRIREQVASLLQKRGMMRAARFVFPHPTRFISHQGERAAFLKTLDDIEEGKGELFAIKDGEQVVAIAGYVHFGQTVEGREVLVITKRITLPGYEGRGYSRELDKRRMEAIREHHPDALVGAVTRNPIVKKSVTKKGFKPVPYRELFQMKVNSGEGTPEWCDAACTYLTENSGWSTYILDPAEQDQDLPSSH